MAHIHDPKVWSRQFQKSSHIRDRETLREMRVQIMEGTFEACETGSYTLRDRSVVPMPDKEIVRDSVRNTVYYYGPPDIPPSRPIYKDMIIEAIELDCLEACHHLIEKGLHPVCLNLASPRRPGGGYRNGAGAQEENLFRRSNYYMSLEDPNNYDKNRRWGYPLPEFGGIYSPDVSVFRGSEDSGYPFLEQGPVPMSFIAVAAYSGPKTVFHRKELRLDEKFADKTLRKMRTILSIAVAQGHDAIVLGAFGCGAFGNPPMDKMVRILRRVLSANFSSNLNSFL
eukprot:TRINITY_DN12141_c0_g1_i1.p1 TRINITY_DN12141_c0_g1~~TRINITY_DN12141_c0_g1_i1.p1  ORF type:complete len:293 (-),score=37.95 TRINITY_DN12141_c0_g1_i1:105-953(-)